MKLTLQVIIYNLWQERNARIFRDTSPQQGTFFKQVDRELRDRLLSLHILTYLMLTLFSSCIFGSLLLIANLFCCDVSFIFPQLCNKLPLQQCKTQKVPYGILTFVPKKNLSIYTQQVVTYHNQYIYDYDFMKQKNRFRYMSNQTCSHLLSTCVG